LTCAAAGNHRQRASIVRLPATRRVERCLVECHCSVLAFGLRRATRDHFGFERREIRVAKVEQFGQ
jgi:hypothetical protein